MAVPDHSARPFDRSTPQGPFGCNGAMRTDPRLRIELYPSRTLRRAILAAAVATLALLLALPLAALVKAASAWLVVLIAIRELERCGARGVPALLHVGIDHRLTVTDARGRSHDGEVRPGTFVAATCICLRWRPVLPARRWSGSRDRTLLIVAGMAAPEVLRELRVRLRYGAAGRGANSGVPAVRPASQSAAAKTRPLAAFDWPATRWR